MNAPGNVRERAAALRNDVDPAERVTAAFDAIEALDDSAIFISTCDRNAALGALDSELPLAGLTFVAKNNIDVHGLVTTAGCPSFAYDPAFSAPAVQRLIDAGATCLGATNLDQFATGLVGTRSPYGVPRNAVDDRLVPGGSSSGSAVAVARSIADFGLGTDTAGSGRVPAAQNRIVGLKPTRGRVPTRGVVPAVRSLDCVSIFGRSVAAASLGLDVVGGWDPDDPWSRPQGSTPLVMPTITIGIPNEVALQSDVDGLAWSQSVERLASLPFIEVVDIDLDPFVEAGMLLYEGPWVAERYAAVGHFLDQQPIDADPTVAAIIGSAKTRTAVEAYEANYRLAELRRVADMAWSAVDVIMMPTTPGIATLDEVAADPVGRNSALGRYTNFVNLLDQAAIAVPGSDRPDGLPFGVTFLGQAWSEETLIDVADRFTGQLQDTPGPFGGSGGIDIVVVGAHLEGQPLNWQLTSHGGRFVRRANTTSNHRLYALGGPGVAKPALICVDPADPGAASIEVEVWRLPATSIGVFSQYIPAPLGLGRVALDDGSMPTGFIAEPSARLDASDITRFGGWRAYLASLTD